MSVALRFEGVTKRYGSRLALDALSFHVPAGTLAGFVGHNGAGKTTTYAIVAGFVAADSGVVDILGRGPFDAHALKGRIGVLPQDAELPEQHTPRELLRHLARLQGMDRRDADREASRVIEAVLLEDRADGRIGALSHGMRRRVAIATALLGSPPLVLLDEPLSGLDPVQARAVRDRLADLRGTSTLVVSSHDLADLERICDWVVMLKDGRRLREGALSEVTHRSRRVFWETGDAPLPLDALRAALPGHTFALEGRELVQEAPDGAVDSSSVAVMRILAEAQVPLRGVRRGVGLEEQFIADVTGAPAARRT